MIRTTLIALALAAVLTGCTGDRDGVLDDIMDPTNPSVTVTTLVPATDMP